MQEELQADANRVGGHDAVLDKVEEPTGPPEATLKRRAQSYSDFHDAVKAFLGKDATPKEKDERYTKKKLGSGAGIETELDFSDWYHELEHELLNSSSDEYT